MSPLRGEAHWEQGSHEGYRRLVVPGGLAGVAIEAGDRRQYGALERFREQVAAAHLDVSQLHAQRQVTYRSSRDRTLQLRFNCDDWLPVAAIDGTRLDFARWPICASPYVNCADGVSGSPEG